MEELKHSIEVSQNRKKQFRGIDEDRSIPYGRNELNIDIHIE